MRIALGAALAAMVWMPPASAQQHTPPPIPKESDSEEAKKEACQKSISEEIGWQLGEAKRLREWCRNNEYITYQQQLEAEKLVK